MTADVQLVDSKCAVASGSFELPDLPGQFWAGVNVREFADSGDALGTRRSVLDPWRSDNRGEFSEGVPDAARESLIEGGVDDASVQCSRTGSCLIWFVADSYVAVLDLHTHGRLDAIDPAGQDGALTALGTYAQDLVSALGAVG